jgi:hypothetical protein
MARNYKLDHFAKGTGATVVPSEESPPSPAQEDLNTVPLPPESRKPRNRGPRTSTPLPPGHVRKKTTGEIGRLESVDPKAGTASVFWLKRGSASTVPLGAISRR